MNLFSKSKVSQNNTRFSQAIMDSLPLAYAIFDEKQNIVDINERMVKLFQFSDATECVEKFDNLSPKYQADGELSEVKAHEILCQAFEVGHAHSQWMHSEPDGNIIPCEITLTRVMISNKPYVVRYIHDLRDFTALAEMRTQLERLASTDGLTGLYNRHYFIDAAEASLQYCMINSIPFSIVMIDADGFKGVSDEHGHDVSDEVLRILARRIRHVLRDDSIVGRYGGDRFIIMLPGIDAKYASKTARRIHDNIVKQQFVMTGFDLSLSITASLGVSTSIAEQSDTSLAEIIERANAAVRKAKDAEGNAVISH
ncbi:MAG: sensor domain-containing diguanylate cyclase [Defluviitaleaceae bacterium]|nr:sensor domain-containing diguanylate cyclase [Defluviitaleaceae bacterium]